MTWPTKLPLVAILRGITPPETEAHVEALLDAGFDAIEIPLNSPVWEISIGQTVRQFGTRALIGAGTALYADQVARLHGLGARLVVTPNTNPQIIHSAVQHGMFVCAGCATATEAFAAIEAGAQVLKIFPSVSFGPQYIKALKAVLPPHVPVLAVGGIHPGNLADYLRVGCTGAGLGGDLYRAGQSAERTLELARQFVDAYRSATA
ncbi:2-dehydro-3-deoxyphosphogalactonate aldolase [Silvimonas terrae]|uniref:2-dehydro-3-deoxyphosphogalactonate aldolase n=1 Tax=Silvimonas terrae TaxID=300266 RepID=A0A840RE02_9NEIS|nr:2-dehydro-3-deoxy-6-phosphogalactonate aldolase [Silvimonas terrae]MBB5190491.1 2-dehydro-3-deoxyphosphogalactonate aldolase [Silvimonas terrae]